MAKLKTSKSSSNAKHRKKLGEKFAKSQTVEELKVTRVASKDKKEREVSDVGQELKSMLSEDEKRLRSVRKKLKDIAELLRKQKDEGIELDNQQLIKVSRLKELMLEMQEFAE